MDQPERDGVPGSPEVAEKASRRRLDGTYKLRILVEAIAVSIMRRLPPDPRLVAG